MDITTTYERAAPKWDKKLYKMGYNHAYREFLKHHIEVTKPVLDVGTGTGIFAYAWVQAGGSQNLTLLDTSSNMLQRAKIRFENNAIRTHLVQKDLMAFQPRRLFSTILAAHVLEHFDQPKTVLEKLFNCLMPGGQLILILSKPHWCNWLIWLRYRHRWFAAEEFIKLANSAGFKNHQIHEFTSGPPSRTSLGYVLKKPVEDCSCKLPMLLLT